MSRGLSNKQKTFISEYLLDMNASDAARRSGYSPKTAFRMGQENMQKPVIREAIQKAMDERAERTEITVDQTLRDIRYVANVCMGREEQVKTIREDGDWIEKKVKQFVPPGALRALELLGKNLKLFTEKKELSVDDEFAALLKMIKPTLGPPSERS